MSDETPTPRTHAAAQAIGKSGVDWYHSATLMMRHAEGMERELTATQSRLRDAEERERGLREALCDVREWMGDSLDAWESLASKFQAATGWLRPGKDYPDCSPQSDEDNAERLKAWSEWSSAQWKALAAKIKALHDPGSGAGQRGVWRKDLENAPRDGSSIIGLYPDGEEAMIMWSDRPVCMAGPVNGGQKPGWATDGSETDRNLPVDAPIAWRPEGEPPKPGPVEGKCSKCGGRGYIHIVNGEFGGSDEECECRLVDYQPPDKEPEQQRAAFNPTAFEAMVEFEAGWVRSGHQLQKDSKGEYYDSTNSHFKAFMAGAVWREGQK